MAVKLIYESFIYACNKAFQVSKLSHFHSQLLAISIKINNKIFLVTKTCSFVAFLLFSLSHSSHAFISSEKLLLAHLLSPLVLAMLCLIRLNLFISEVDVHAYNSRGQQWNGRRKACSALKLSSSSHSPFC